MSHHYRQRHACCNSCQRSPYKAAAVEPKPSTSKHRAACPIHRNSGPVNQHQRQNSEFEWASPMDLCLSSDQPGRLHGSGGRVGNTTVPTSQPLSALPVRPSHRKAHASPWLSAVFVEQLHSSLSLQVFEHICMNLRFQALQLWMPQHLHYSCVLGQRTSPSSSDRLPLRATSEACVK